MSKIYHKHYFGGYFYMHVKNKKKLFRMNQSLHHVESVPVISYAEHMVGQLASHFQIAVGVDSTNYDLFLDKILFVQYRDLFLVVHPELAIPLLKLHFALLDKEVDIVWDKIKKLLLKSNYINLHSNLFNVPAIISSTVTKALPFGRRSLMHTVGFSFATLMPAAENTNKNN